MKTLLKWALPAVLGIVPTLSADADKAFLSHPGAVYKITRVREAEVLGKQTLTATVDANLTDQQKIERNISVEDPFGRFAGTSWVHHDDQLYSNRKGKVYITLFENGGLLGETEPFVYTKEEETSYTKGKTEVVNLLQGVVTSNDKLLLGAKVDVATQTHYTRPDNSPYVVTEVINQALTQATSDDKILTEADLLQLPLTSDTNPPLEVYKIPYIGDVLNPEGKQLIYKLAIREARVAGQMFYRCYEHKNETSNQGFKVKTTLRHWYEHYNTTLVTPQVVKILLDDQEVVHLTGTTITELRLNGRDTGRTNQPNCTPLGSAFPPNSKVIV